MKSQASPAEERFKNFDYFQVFPAISMDLQKRLFCYLYAPYK